MSDIVERLNIQARDGLLGISEDFKIVGYREAADTISALTVERDALRQRTEELERFLFPYANNKEISGISWDGKYLIGDKASISFFHEMKNRGEQIDVYKSAYDQKIDAADSTITALRQQLDEAVEALELFSDEADHYDPEEGDDDDPAFATRVKSGDLRRARDIIRKVKA